jgi:predicted 3-demethylubiquinone-9 3-methyltransferase (glyoxalase superfamily)
MPIITTFLAFNNRAEEAANLYVSIFKNSRILKTTRYGEGGPMITGLVMTVVFELDGQRFVALNGGPHFKFTDGISLSVECTTQQEIDDYTEKLSSGGGEVGPCGWVKDRFGLSWQVDPTILGELLSDPDRVKADRVMQAMLKMKKIDIDGLKRAYAGHE